MTLALEMRGVVKSFATPGGARRRVLDVAELSLAEGEQVALRGESGSGKSTLLHLAGGILRPDAGMIRVAGADIAAMSEADRDVHRARHVGYVFQRFHLLPQYSALENVLLGMAFGGGVDRDRAAALLTRLDLADRRDDRPRALSVGQQQRVAVARALANRPRLVLADEPTGNLDERRARDALSLLREACAEEGAALLLVSHDPRALVGFERVLDLGALSPEAPEVSP